MRSVSVLHCCVFAIVSFLVVIPCAKATDYNESISGDLSNNQAVPTPLTLTLGSNAIIGSVNGGTDSQDWITFTIQPGFVMSSYVNAAYTSSDNQGFTGFQFGSAFAGSPGAAASYAGYAHFGTGATNPSIPTSTVGVDLLPLMANPSVAQGASGFTPPLAAGTYTFLIQQLGSATNYEFDATVSAAVPEPASLWLFAVGSVGLLALRRRKRTS